MRKIYMDNAATTFPKPSQVPEAVYRYMTEQGTNINRGSYGDACDVEMTVYETRELLTKIFNAESIRHVVFTRCVTESLNILMKGFLKSGDHVLVSAMEHNAVMRPLTQLLANGVVFTRIPCRIDGTLEVEKIPELVTARTKLIVMTHASNVCGTVLPIREVGTICRRLGLRFFLDAAQTAGVIPIDMEAMMIDALAFTGHKGLLAPQGIGGFILRPDFEKEIEPLVVGGTGSVSHLEEIPSFMPDRFEAGTQNLPGIVGLNAALKWLMKTGTENILDHELRLTDSFLTGLRALETDGLIRVVGKRDLFDRVGVISIMTEKSDPAEIADRLDRDYGIMTRVGLHCAPSAHQTLRTYPTGTIRFSFGYWNTLDEVEIVLKALAEVLNGF